MNSMNDQIFFDLAMKAIARQASVSERAELEALLSLHPELKAEFERLQADADKARKTLALASATEAVSPELPAYLRGRLQTKVRQTLGRAPAPDGRNRKMVWNWRWILGLAAGATAVVLLLSVKFTEEQPALMKLDLAANPHASRQIQTAKTADAPAVAPVRSHSPAAASPAPTASRQKLEIASAEAPIPLRQHAAAPLTPTNVTREVVDAAAPVSPQPPMAATMTPTNNLPAGNVLAYSDTMVAAAGNSDRPATVRSHPFYNASPAPSGRMAGSPPSAKAAGASRSEVASWFAAAGLKTPSAFGGALVADAPIQLNYTPVNLQVSLPAHRWKKIPISVSRADMLSIELHVAKGNPINVALIHAGELADLEQTNGVIRSKKLQKASLPEFKAVKIIDYSQKHLIEAGDFLVVLQDTTMGILSAATNDIEIHICLTRKEP
jgi:hypothetical protein